MDQEEKLLRQNLERWRNVRLREIEDYLEELRKDFRAAQDGLAIPHKNPGEIAEDVIEYLWEKLNRSATELSCLEEEHERLRTMPLPELVVAFKQDFSARDGAAIAAAPGSVDVMSAQVTEIIAAWRDLLGIQLDPERVRAHLDSINKWQHQWRERRENAERS